MRLHLDPMGGQVIHTIRPSITAIDDQNFGDATMVNELSAHHARLAGNDEPGAERAHAVARRVADQIRFRMMTADLHARARFNFLQIPVANLAAAKPSTAARPTVITIGQHHVGLRLKQHGAKFTPRAIARTRQS
jgi:hypothetical protein